MSIQVHWLLNNKILFRRSHGRITVDQLDEMTAFTVKHMDDSPHQLIHILHDLHDSHPTISINDARRLLRKVLEHPKLGWIVFYGLRDKSTQFLLMLLASIFRVQVRFVDTFDVGLSFLQKYEHENILHISEPELFQELSYRKS